MGMSLNQRGLFQGVVRDVHDRTKKLCPGMNDTLRKNFCDTTHALMMQVPCFVPILKGRFSKYWVYRGRKHMNVLGLEEKFDYENVMYKLLCFELRHCVYIIETLRFLIFSFI